MNLHKYRRQPVKQTKQAQNKILSLWEKYFNESPGLMSGKWTAKQRDLFKEICELADK